MAPEDRDELLGEREVAPIAFVAVAPCELRREWHDAVQHASFLSVKRVAPDDGLVSVGPGGDHVYRHAADRLQALEIGARTRRKLVVFAHAHGAVLPARKDFVDRLAE